MKIMKNCAIVVKAGIVKKSFSHSKKGNSETIIVFINVDEID